MRKLILFIATSLDGYIAGENDAIDWLFTDQDYGFSPFYNHIDTLLIGRKTYEVLCTFEGYPYPDKQNYIFTQKKDLPNPQPEFIHFIQEPVADFTAKLKQQAGNAIWLVGGGGLLYSLLQNQLVDEIIVSVHPILLGKGVLLYHRLDAPIHLRLLNIEHFNTGLVQFHYAVQYESNHVQYFT